MEAVPMKTQLSLLTHVLVENEQKVIAVLIASQLILLKSSLVQLYLFVKYCCVQGKEHFSIMMLLESL